MRLSTVTDEAAIRGLHAHNHQVIGNTQTRCIACGSRFIFIKDKLWMVKVGDTEQRTGCTLTNRN